MTRIAYFDCFSGCSGDMLLGALLDAGLELDRLREGIESLGIAGLKISAQKVMRGVLSATKFDVTVAGSSKVSKRRLSGILEMISSSDLSRSVKAGSSAVFERLAGVEAKIHGISVEDVHFHELGAIDSIVDIVGTFLGLELLGVERCYCSPLPAGRGTVRCAHGTLPLPAPATLQLLAEARVPLTSQPVVLTQPVELVTPTGAALLVHLCDFKQPAIALDTVGYGAGSKELQDWPNVLRVWLGEESGTTDAQGLVLLETNIDDMEPRIYGYLMEKLFEQGAADVWFTPIQMKKDRPAVMLSVITSSADESAIVDIIMRQTSTLGVRSRSVARHIASREVEEFASSLGPVKVKLKRFYGAIAGISAEYEDCRRIAEECSIPLREVIRIVEEEARDQIKE